MATHGSVVGVVGSRRRASLNAHRVFAALLSFVLASPLVFAGGHIRVPRRASPVARHFRALSNEEALELINEDEEIIVLDVRLPDEQIQLGHLMAKHPIPTVTMPVPIGEMFNEDLFLSRLKIIIPDKRLKYLVSCSEGVRSRVIANVLEKNGYRSVYELLEGVIGWREEGFPVIPVEGHEDKFEPTLLDQQM